MKLEEILNKCISMGWKPRSFGYKSHIRITSNKLIALYGDDDIYYYSINDLCSIESLFWQFICDNNLVLDKKFDIINTSKREIKYGGTEYTSTDGYAIYTTDIFKYRLMLSSIQEDKAKFIEENILLPKYN